MTKPARLRFFSSAAVSTEVNAMALTSWDRNILITGGAGFM